MRRGFLALLEIIRPHNMLAAGLGVVAGYYVAAGTASARVMVVALVAALATGAGNVINDYYDFAIDRVNKPRRPLPSGRLSPRAARVWYAVLVVATTLLAAIALPQPLLVLALVWQLALFAYARVLKRTWIAGNVTVALVSASAFLAGAMAADWPGAAVIPMAIAFAFVMCREMIKGGEDLEGDRDAGVRTLAVVSGPERAARVAAGAMLLLAVLVPLPALAGLYGLRYFLAMEVLVAPVLILGALAVVRRPERRVFGRVSRALKLAMFAGILAIALGV
ncbi:MAG: geranylgeranylglycerol-phosphate geranylgeranyltransferase [Candidatus Krumholzibacteria bacterium]|nr:geranylgeranylglycerol-phosphate geranylgeranyltransferase [Candidatus Krumholzibacteria bacterium]MDH4336651.1 geranylgeranylglycerol-phosphate geranylgeranyltransferase [Candidatus Krumholzibacteria bacterium]MDH5268994.1 geranylgeranylglycerol-phosphate geranylgeranyltransferase [Candidatus Krumholzibacteria bacterium]